MTHRTYIHCRLTTSLPAAWLAGLLLTFSTGCVALSIPSVRYNDPSDRGGLLGPQRPADSHAALNPESYETAACHAGGDALGDESFDGEQPPPPPEVPWPRFHPLPTRPVFSP